jgi:tetratricopeptide (TPR) repeat protein
LTPPAVLADEGIANVSSGKQNAQALYISAIQDFNAHRFVDASDKLSELSKIAPEIEVQQLLGCSLMSLGKYQDALEHLKRSAESKPNNFDAHMALGIDLQHLCRLREATQQYEEAKRIDPNNLDTERQLCFALMTLGRHKEAAEHLDRLVQACPNEPRPRQDLGTELISAGDLPKALTVLQDLINRFPSFPNTPTVKAYILRIRQEIDKQGETPDNVSGPDYFAVVKERWDKEMFGFHPHWADSRMPLRVKIHSGEGVRSYLPEYDKVLRESFEAWQKASHELIRFSFVDSEKDADIQCYWISDGSELSTGSDAGAEAMPHCKDDLILSGVIKVMPSQFVVQSADPNIVSWSSATLHRLCLHEVGHIIGIQAHSPNPNDATYFWCAVQDNQPKPTARDVATLIRIHNYVVQPKQ